jgi:hypothetical protein
MSGLTVQNELGSYSFVGMKGQPASLPSGDCSVKDCRILLVSKDGSRLALDCTLNSSVSIPPDGEAAIDISGKVTGQINPKQKELVWIAGSSASLDWVIKIGDKIAVSEIGDSKPKYAPTIKFLDAKGRLAATAKGGFG